jgi:hypothetical protein
MSIDDATPEDWDKVNSPKHYNQHGGPETIESIKASLGQAKFVGYLHGNIIKYGSRWDKKGQPVEDLQKMMWYTKRLIEELE